MMITMHPHIKTIRLAAAAIMMVFASMLLLNSNPVAAAAACVDGLPCDTPQTPAELANPTAGPNADKSTSDACDANFMNQIYAKAFLEAEREVVVANTSILKPDSVLEYTCLDQLVTPVAEDAGPIFSESDRWSTDNIDVIGDNVTIDVFMGQRLFGFQLGFKTPPLKGGLTGFTKFWLIQKIRLLRHHGLRYPTFYYSHYTRYSHLN